MANLLCSNCGAVFGDAGDWNYIPVCPHCNYSHYTDTDLGVRLPQAAHYRVHIPRDADPTKLGQEDSYWAKYAHYREMFDQVPQIDDEVAHRKADHWAREPRLCSRHRAIAQAMWETKNRQRRHEVELDLRLVEVAQALCIEGSLDDVIISQQFMEEAERLWHEQDQGMGLSYEDALELKSPGKQGTPEERAFYNKVKQRVSRVRRKYLAGVVKN